MKKTMKKSTKGFLNNLITYAIVIIAFVFTQMALSKMIPGVTISRSLKGQLIPICVYIVMAVSLNLTVGISGAGSRGLHERRRFLRHHHVRLAAERLPDGK